MAALGAEAVGIMQTLLDQTLEYTRIRKQFGRPLSANQVIRHRLADMAMQCDEARSMALRAALMADAEPVARSRAASGAKAKIGKCARFVAEQSVQLHGAIGVTEELDTGPTSSGCSPLTRCSAAAPITIAVTPPSAAVPCRPERDISMDLAFNAEERAFENEVRDFIAANLTPEMKRATALTPSVFSDPTSAWPGSAPCTRKAGARRAGRWTMAGRAGRRRSAGSSRAECARAGAPGSDVIGVKMVGPVIIGFGTPEQKDYYLPRILSGEDYWCQGYSEPGSGSDLASLKTRAVRDGDDYVVNGTKIWTTHAHFANRMFALVRTTEGRAAAGRHHPSS